MDQRIINNELVDENEVNETAIRVKAIILNSKKEVLLAYSYNTYQFPGGHLEEDEPLIPALNRELKEETGLDFKLENTDIKPFYTITHYSRNYRGTGKVRKNTIYYFLLKTDTVYSEKTNCLDSVEKCGEFELLYVPYNELEPLLIRSIPDNPINKLIVEEMLEILDVIKNRAVIVW
jgi:8-oxo-dGTP pyrophosphatase MutT (NUDIX family)